MPDEQKYDIGALTRRFQQRFRLFSASPLAQTTANDATPAKLATFLDELARLTADVVVARASMSDWTPDAGIFQWDTDLLRWRGRLEAYRDAVRAAAPDDRQAVLWSVTAPLLLGYFGGEASKLPQQPIDAITPFTLANQLAVDDAWREERLQLFKDELVAPVALGGGLAIAVGVAVLVALLLRK